MPDHSSPSFHISPTDEILKKTQAAFKPLRRRSIAPFKNGGCAANKDFILVADGYFDSINLENTLALRRFVIPSKIFAGNGVGMIK